VRPFTDLPSIYQRVSTENFNEMSDASKEFWESHTLLGKAWAALKTLGSTAGYVMSPAQAGIESFAGQPLEKSIHVPGTAKHIGEWGSFATQLAVDPLAAVGRGLGAAREATLPAVAEKMFSPSNRPWRVEREMPDPFGSGTLKVPDLNPRIGYGILPNPNYGKPIVDKFPAPARVARTISKWLTRSHISGEQARAALEPFQQTARELPEDARKEFILWMAGERTGPLARGLQPLAEVLRKEIDKREARLVSAGLLEHATESYWPRMFKNPALAERNLNDYQLAQAAAHTRRPMQGSRRAAGLLKRTVPTLEESLDKGMELVTTNPIDYALLRMDGMDKYFYGTMIGREMKNLPYVRFLRQGLEGLARLQGWEALDDKIFEAWLPPAHVSETFNVELVNKVIHNTSFDTSVRAGLEDIARWLGVRISTPLRHEDPQFAQPGFETARGYASRPTWQGRPMPDPRAVSEFGNDAGTLLHEVGHQIDFKYNLWNVFRGNQQAKKELEELARLRWEHPWSALSARDKRYLLDPEEQMANLLHAYWHAPRFLEEIAPTAKTVFEQWLSNAGPRATAAERAERATLKGLIENVKPKLKMTTEKQEREYRQTFEEKFEKAFPGVRLLGKWYAPEPVARVFNNYVSDERKYQDLYDAFRKLGGAFNNLQLGLSFFHYGMVSIDSSVSAMAGLPYAVRAGKWGRAADRAVSSMLPLVGPIYSGVRRMATGIPLRRAIRHPEDPRWLTPEFQQFMSMFDKSGGRLSMDMIHRSSGMGGFGKAIKGGYLWDSIKDTFKQVKNPNPMVKAILGGVSLGARLLETSMEPIMEWFVPNVKMGVFHDMVRDWLEKNPRSTDDQMAEAAQRLWDSVDNRMGQMVYDNLFWSRTLKNTAFIAVRAVGWNLGTEREIGGGIADAVHSMGKVLTGSGPAEITERTKYTLALPVVVAVQGAMLNYLYTGEGPREIMDYFFPRNGRLTPEGAEERVSMPSYVKDVFSYNYDAGGTILNKLHPLWSTMIEFYNNKDYFGAIISTKYDPTHPMIQRAEYLLHQLTPFSWRGFKRQLNEGADVFPLIMSAFGFVPAPGRITNPPKNQRYEDLQEMKGYKRRLREQSMGR
jgi:hypothetical protein